MKRTLVALAAVLAFPGIAQAGPHTPKGYRVAVVAQKPVPNWVKPEERAITYQLNCPPGQAPAPGAAFGVPCSGFEAGPSVVSWDYHKGTNAPLGGTGGNLTGWDSSYKVFDAGTVFIGSTGWLRRHGVPPPSSVKIGTTGCCMPYAVVDTSHTDASQPASYAPAEWAATMSAETINMLVNPKRAIKTRGLTVLPANPPINFAASNNYGYDALIYAYPSAYPYFSFPFHTSYNSICPGNSALPGTPYCPMADWTKNDYWYKWDTEQRTVNAQNYFQPYDKFGVLKSPSYNCANDPDCL